MTYDRDPKYLHPYIADRLESILNAINTKLPADHTAKLISAHRTPADQFEIFKKGRTFKNGSWVKTGQTFTDKDGFVKLSRHNYLPCTAFDIGIFNGNAYLPDSPLYKNIKEGKKFEMDWGGDWTSLVDEPHLEIPPNKFFKSNIEKDSGVIWQNYLRKAGTYTGGLDGIFGPKSIQALIDATGESVRNLKAWDKLFDKFGKPEAVSILTTILELENVTGISNISLEAALEDRPVPPPGNRPTPNPGDRPKPNPGDRPRPTPLKRPRPGSN